MEELNNRFNRCVETLGPMWRKFERKCLAQQLGSRPAAGSQSIPSCEMKSPTSFSGGGPDAMNGNRMRRAPIWRKRHVLHCGRTHYSTDWYGFCTWEVALSTICSTSVPVFDHFPRQDMLTYGIKFTEGADWESSILRQIKLHDRQISAIWYCCSKFVT